MGACECKRFPKAVNCVELETISALKNAATPNGEELQFLQHYLLKRLRTAQGELIFPPLSRVGWLIFSDVAFSLDHLRVLLCSGDCTLCESTKQSGLSVNVRASAWREALYLLCYLLSHVHEKRTRLCVSGTRRDGHIPKPESIEFRLSVAIALSFCYQRFSNDSSTPDLRYNTNYSQCNPNGTRRIQALERYNIFWAWSAEAMCNNAMTSKHGDMIVLGQLFHTLSAWEMRFIVSVPFTTLELNWVRQEIVESARSKLAEKSFSAKPQSQNSSVVLNSIIAQITFTKVKYTLFNTKGVSVQQGPDFYDKSADDITIMDFVAKGAVCGGISKFGTSCCVAALCPAFPVGQPGHCAFVYQKQRGEWEILNDACFGWSQTWRHHGVQFPWGCEFAWSVVAMQLSQMTFLDFASSELLRMRAGHLFNEFFKSEPKNNRGSYQARSECATCLEKCSALLAEATNKCKYNLAAWMGLIAVTRALNYDLVEQSEGYSSKVLARWKIKQIQRPQNKEKDTKMCDFDLAFYSLNVRASDETLRSAKNVIDGTNSEWWTSNDEAWIELDLRAKQHSTIWPIVSKAKKYVDKANDESKNSNGDNDELPSENKITGIHIKWWGYSYAQSVQIWAKSSPRDEYELLFTERDIVPPPHGFPSIGNGTCNGWSCWPAVSNERCRYPNFLKFKFAKGKLDPWNKGFRLGIRRVQVWGRQAKPGIRHTDVILPQMDDLQILRANLSATWQPRFYGVNVNGNERDVSDNVNTPPNTSDAMVEIWKFLIAQTHGTRKCIRCGHYLSVRWSPQDLQQLLFETEIGYGMVGKVEEYLCPCSKHRHHIATPKTQK